MKAQVFESTWDWAAGHGWVPNQDMSQLILRHNYSQVRVWEPEVAYHKALNDKQIDGLPCQIAFDSGDSVPHSKTCTHGLSTVGMQMGLQRDGRLRLQDSGLN